MVQEYHTGDEPVPGYRLSKFLGRGGFGEVWQAVAPGRTEVALKIITLDRKQGMKEFRSLRLVKRVRHPNLAPILAFWLKDADGNVMDDDSAEMLGANVTDSQWQGKSAYFNVARATQLVIAMGLGDKNLLTLLQEYQATGQQGIPDEELLDYMEGCARAIDFLNSPRHDLGSGPVAIQHCDIKPQNIMIVGDAVQLCDFGLARSLTDVRSTSVAGSIAYGAPELFWENKPSEATDQYSLAVSYYELRTGQLPFGPEMAHIEVMQAHRDGTLDFSHIADAEREVLVRATSPSPAGRFPRTIDMVRALRRAVQSSSHAMPAGPALAPAARSDTSLLITGREIVPGFTLNEHLFHADPATDVWSASGRGSKPLALWIYDLSHAGGMPDLASLRMARAFSHPQFAQIHDFWLQDASGQLLSLDAAADSDVFASASRLIVASELARTNLAHRLDECRQTRGGGIPPGELFGYLRPLAAAIDALNEPRHASGDSRQAALMHCDLRPANLLLFHSEVKIGNLAWARSLESDAMQLPGGARRSLRPFAGPELARDRLTRWSDQYALAASYVVLRTGGQTGDMPSAAGQAPSAIAASLDLSKLPAAEMAVLAKALHARPEQRFANCRELVAALESASQAAPAASVASGESPAGGPGNRWGGTIVAPSPDDVSPDEAAVGVATGAEPKAIADTAPEHDVRRSTLIEPFGEAGPATGPVAGKPRRGLRLVLAGVAAAAALGAALVVGDGARHDARRLADAGQYKQAIETLDGAPVWRSWRVDRPALRRSLVTEALSASEDAAKAGKISEACAAFAELAAMPDALFKADIDNFRETMLPAAIARAREELSAGSYRRAGEIQHHLAGVFKENFEVVALGQSILDQGAAAAIGRARENDLKSALAIFDDLNALAPEAEQVAKLKAVLKPDHTTKAPGEKAGPEQIVVALLDEVDGDLETGLVDGSEAMLKRAEAAAAKLKDAKSLLRRLALTRAHVAFRQARWDDAAKLLAGMQRGDFAASELVQRARCEGLRALVLARFDGGELAADADLRQLAQALAAAQDDLSWRTGNRFRLDVDRLNKLSDQTLRRAIDLAYSDKPEERQLAGEVLKDLSSKAAETAGAAIQARSAAAQTHLLLAAAESPPREAVSASLAAWRDRVGDVDPKAIDVTARDLSRWATQSPEPGALDAGIAALGELRRRSDQAKTEYAGLLIEKLAREAAVAAPKWETLSELSQSAADAATVAGGHPRLSFVLACRAECAKEAPADARQRPTAIMAEARKMPVAEGDRPYLDYVDALARAGEDSPPSPDALRSAAALIASAFAEPAGILNVAHRKTRAAETLSAAAAAVAGLGGAAQNDLEPPAMAAEVADEAYGWLQTAARLSPAATSPEARLAMAASALRKTDPDEAAANSLAAKLLDDGRREGWLLLMRARDLESQQPAQAAVYYADALAGIDLNAIAGEAARRAYSRVVEPAVALAERSLPPAAADAAARQAIAKLYAAQGRLLRANPTLVSGGASPDEQSFRAFDRAIKYDDARAELYVERGYARWSSHRNKAEMLAALEREDLGKAFELLGDKPSPAALGLRGNARLIASRNRSGAEQLQALEGAIEDYLAAIEAAAGQGEHYSEFLDGGASAYVELANFSNAGRAQYKVYLEQAIALAKESTDIEFRPAPEYAWLNLGNAEEDMIWRAGDYGVDHYCRAIDAFQKAAADAVKNGRAPEFALSNEGRCRWKLVEAVLDGKIAKEQMCGGTIEEHIETGLKSLGDAAERLDRAERAEARLWQARLYGQKARTKSGAEAKQALDDADASLKAALAAIDESDPSWPTYQIEYASSAWAMQRYDAVRERSLALLDSKSPAATAEKKGSVVPLVAMTYALAGDAKRGLQEFQTRVEASEFRDQPAAQADLLVGRSAFILRNGLWQQSKQLCESGARQAIELARKADARGIEARAWVVLFEHLVLAHPKATIEQVKECSAALSQAISLGLSPAVQLSSSVQLARTNLQLAQGELPLADRLQYANQGLKAIDKNSVAGATPPQARVIDKLRADLEKEAAELRQQIGKPAPPAPK